MVSIFAHPFLEQRPRVNPFDLHYYPEDDYEYHPMFTPRSRSRCNGYPYRHAYPSACGFAPHHQDEESELAHLLQGLRRPRTAPARSARRSFPHQQNTVLQQRNGTEVQTQEQKLTAQDEKEKELLKAAEKLAAKEEDNETSSSSSSSSASSDKEDSEMSSDSEAPEDEAMNTDEEDEEESRMEEEKMSGNFTESMSSTCTSSEQQPQQQQQPQDNPTAVIKKGDTVLYKQRDNSLAPVQIVSIDHGLVPPSYVIKINGSERETERSRLIVPLSSSSSAAAAASV